MEKYNGQGTFTYSNGGKYVGEYKDGDRNGQGTHTFSKWRKVCGGIQGWKKEWSRNTHLH